LAAGAVDGVESAALEHTLTLTRRKITGQCWTTVICDLAL